MQNNYQQQNYQQSVYQQPQPQKSKLNIIIIALIVVIIVGAIIIIPGMAKKGDNNINEENITTTNSGVTDSCVVDEIYPSTNMDVTSNCVVDEIYPNHNINIGDTYTFGSYEQDHNLENGKDPIEWIVLDVQNSKILVISKYALDCQTYNRELTDVTWETCDMRTWVNDPFFRTAFSESEASKICTVTVTTEGSNSTSDKLFLLSADEADKYFFSETEKKCEPSVWAKKVGIRKNADNYCGWWLRTSGNSKSNAAFVDTYGKTNHDGTTVDTYAHGVRPAMWIDLAA